MQKNNENCDLIRLVWQYSGDNWYEFTSYDSAMIGKLYRLKVLESQVECIKVIKGESVVISWNKEND